MPVARYLAHGQSGGCYVRLRIPADLLARFGRKVVKRSTGTMCDRAALGAAPLVPAVLCSSPGSHISNGGMDRSWESA